MSESAFDRFWAVYPRRVAKKDAVKAWGQVDGDRHAEAILAALEWQAPAMLESEPQYRPHPATWLRGERWTDEPPPEVLAKRQRAEAEEARRTRLDREYHAAYERRHGRSA